MPKRTGKRVALNKLTLTKRAVEAMKPADKPWIAWDDKLTGFSIQVHPSGIQILLRQLSYRQRWQKGIQQACRSWPL